MYKFVSAEASQRHAYLDTAIQDVEAALQTETAVYYLSEGTALSISTLLGELYVPNIHEGLIVPPTGGIDPKKTPIVAAMPGEELRLDPAFARMHPRQLKALTRKMGAWGLEDEVDIQESIDFIDNSLVDEGGLEIRDASTSRGFVRSYAREITLLGDSFRHAGKREKMFRGAPIVGLVMEEDAPPEETAVVAVHELQHVAQTHLDPVVSSDRVKIKRLQRELEAYRVGALFGLALSMTPGGRYEGSKAAVFQWAVENLRQEHADPARPFRANAALRRALRQADLNLAG